MVFNNSAGITRRLSSSTLRNILELLTLILNHPSYGLLAVLVLALALPVILHEPSNRRAVRLVRAWKDPKGK
jgi:hypothetical protein